MKSHKITILKLSTDTLKSYLRTVKKYFCLPLERASEKHIAPLPSTGSTEMHTVIHIESQDSHSQNTDKQKNIKCDHTLCLCNQV